jgi:hypothetical protein
MRAKFWLTTTVIALAAIFLLGDPDRSFSQQGGGKKGGGKKGFGDPAEIWDKYLDPAKKGYIVIGEQKRGGQELQMLAEKVGITDGKITRDQYLRYYDQLQTIREELWAKGGFGKGFGKGGDFGKNGENKGGDPKSGDPAKGDFGKKGEFGGKGKKGRDPDAVAEEEFTRYDVNQDKLLDENEIMTKTKIFKTVWKDYDANKDAKISLEEYKTYRKNLGGGPKGGGPAPATPDSTKPPLERTEGSADLSELDRKVLVYRADSLPSDVPGWFKEYDEDRDCQVALYEWRKHGKSDEEFMSMDRNDDGLLTVEEVLSFVRVSSSGNQTATPPKTSDGGGKRRKGGG